MVIVIHGDDQSASRKRLSDIRDHYSAKNWKIMNLAKSTNLDEINLSARAQTLLSESLIVVIEDFWGGKPPKASLAKGGRKASPAAIVGNVIFWESKELSKMLIASFPKDWKIENFPIPQVAFKFLETLSGGKPQDSIKMLHNMQNDNVFSLIPLVAWHVRYLIWAQEEPKSLSLPSWRAQKLEAQASKFKLEGLYKFHEQLLNLDRTIKTGTNILSPLASLELLIANL